MKHATFSTMSHLSVLSVLQDTIRELLAGATAEVATAEPGFHILLFLFSLGKSTRWYIMAAGCAF